MLGRVWPIREFGGCGECAPSGVGALSSCMVYMSVCVCDLDAALNFVSAKNIFEAPHTYTQSIHSATLIFFAQTNVCVIYKYVCRYC